MHDDPQALSADVGKALKATRRRLGITQATLSAKTGIAQADISRLESGKSNTAVQTLGRLAEGMGCRMVIAFKEKFENELETRTGVSTEIVGPYEHKEVTGDGPAVGLVVID